MQASPYLRELGLALAQTRKDLPWENMTAGARPRAGRPSKAVHAAAVLHQTPNAKDGLLLLVGVSAECVLVRALQLVLFLCLESLLLLWQMFDVCDTSHSHALEVGEPDIASHWHPVSCESAKYW